MYTITKELNKHMLLIVQTFFKLLDRDYSLISLKTSSISINKIIMLNEMSMLRAIKYTLY